MKKIGKIAWKDKKKVTRVERDASLITIELAIVVRLRRTHEDVREIYIYIYIGNAS